MQTITAYRAADGTIFDNKEACEAHDRSRMWETPIRDFMREHNIGKTQYGILSKYIPLWEAYQNKLQRQ